MSLDEANINSGYRLGRLFAVLEKIQEEANPGINATIRESVLRSSVKYTGHGVFNSDEAEKPSSL